MMWLSVLYKKMSRCLFIASKSARRALRIDHIPKNGSAMVSPRQPKELGSTLDNGVISAAQSPVVRCTPPGWAWLWRKEFRSGPLLVKVLRKTVLS